jgi:hypothetical protein
MGLSSLSCGWSWRLTLSVIEDTIKKTMSRDNEPCVLELLASHIHINIIA